MKILVDTNILISALLFPHSKPAKALLHIARYHNMVLCDRNLDELRDVLNRKAPSHLPAAEELLADLVYERIPSSSHREKSIRDIKDQPILNAAIQADVDIIVTGDKDFLCLDLDHPKCMTASEFWIQKA
jgi:putative PIN family toxin of toxin-antitoxin system